MDIEKITSVCPGLLKLGFDTLRNLLEKKSIKTFNPNKTWEEMGFDDLDMIEIIMQLEKDLDFSFPDQIFEDVFGLDKKPIDFKSYSRNKIIDSIIDVNKR